MEGGTVPFHQTISGERDGVDWLFGVEIGGENKKGPSFHSGLLFQTAQLTNLFPGLRGASLDGRLATGGLFLKDGVKSALILA